MAYVDYYADLHADIVSACGASWTDVYFYVFFLDNLMVGLYGFFILFGGASEIRSTSLTSHDVGLANHILVESYDIFVG